MPIAEVNGLSLYYEEHGRGTPVLLLHELAADLRSWDEQTHFLARRHRVVAFNLRGYPPSSVPLEAGQYSHDALIGDAVALLDHLRIGQAFVVGHGTGGNLALGLALRHASRVRGLVLAGSGAGFGNPNWKSRSDNFAASIEDEGIGALERSVSAAPQRQPFADKDPLGWQRFIAGINRLSPEGCARLIRNGVRNRPSFLDLKGEIANLFLPVLVLVGDRDAPAFEASVFVARTAPHAALAVLPFCGHTLVLEEPSLVNRHLAEFFAQVDGHQWAGWAGGRPQP